MSVKGFFTKKLNWNGNTKKILGWLSLLSFIGGALVGYTKISWAYKDVSENKKEVEEVKCVVEKEVGRLDEKIDNCAKDLNAKREETEKDMVKLQSDVKSIKEIVDKTDKKVDKIVDILIDR